MSFALTWATGAEIAAAVSAGQVSAADVVEGTLKRIEALDQKLNSFTMVTIERARAKAKAIDVARAKGVQPGPLSGVPFAVKNLFDIAGLPTIAGSKINRSRPAADAIRR